MASFERAFVAVNRALVGLLLAAIFGLVFTNVVLRYGFGFSLSWSEEIARFLMVAGAYLGAGLALREGRLVAIDILVDALPPLAGRLLRTLIAVLLIAFALALVWYGIKFAEFGWNKETMATQISRGIPYMAIPIGAAFFLVHTLLFFRRFIARDFENVEDFATEDDEGGKA